MPCLSQEKGHMPTGGPRPRGSERGAAGRRVLHWWMLTFSMPQPQSPAGSGGFWPTPSGGTKRHRTQRMCPLTTWSPSPNTPALVWAALTAAPTKHCHILAEAPWAGPQHLATRRSDRQLLRSVYQRTCSLTIALNSLL